MDHLPSDSIIISEEEFLDDFENIKLKCPLCSKEFLVYNMEMGECETVFKNNATHAMYEYSYGEFPSGKNWGWKWILIFSFNEIDYVVEILEKKISVFKYGHYEHIITFDFIPMDENFIFNLQNLLLLS